MQGDVDIFRIQVISIIGSLVLMVFIVELIRREKINIEYSLIWFFSCFLFLVLSIWREGLDIVSHYIGIAYAPATLFLFLMIALFMILIHFSIIISKQAKTNRLMVQEIGLLKLEIETIQKSINNNKSVKGE